MNNFGVFIHSVYRFRYRYTPLQKTKRETTTSISILLSISPYTRKPNVPFNRSLTTHRASIEARFSELMPALTRGCSI
jgi:hypothetical protein